MGRKRTRLTAEQEKRFKHLEWYLDNKVDWVGDQNLKDVVLDGKYAILFSNAHDWVDNKIPFDIIVCADSLDNVEAVIKYSTSSLIRVVELDYLMELKEVRKMREPSFENYVEMLDS